MRSCGSVAQLKAAVGKREAALIKTGVIIILFLAFLRRFNYNAILSLGVLRADKHGIIAA